jgi:hypothetical protein
VSDLKFSVIGARIEPYAASPLFCLRLKIEETTGARIDAIALRVQMMIEPQRRRYEAQESERLTDLFGDPSRYGDTLRPLLWTHVSTMVLRFTSETEIDLHVPCSFDLEVAAHKYLRALEHGEIPVNLYFSGTVFVESAQGVTSEFVPWSCEARYRLPVATWLATMDAYFPNSAWLRIRRDVYEELDRFRRERALPTWDAALTLLCERARRNEPVPIRSEGALRP